MVGTAYSLIFSTSSFGTYTLRGHGNEPAVENLDAHCAKVKTMHRTAALDPMLIGILSQYCD